MPGQDVKVDDIYTSHGRNYLAVTTRQSALDIKVSGRMCSDEFKRKKARLQLHSNNFGLK